MKFSVGQTFIKHREIITKIEESLHGIALRQGSTSNMIHVTLRDTINQSTTDAKSPTKIYFLIMGEEPAIKSSCRPIILAAYHQGCSCGPKNGLLIIILSLITLYGIEYPTTAEGITQMVYITTTGSCVLKTVTIRHGKQLRLTGSGIGMIIHKLYQRCKPMMGDLYV